jgi:hypothetical protein
VLKSWAVPKVPSEDSKDKGLALQMVNMRPDKYVANMSKKLAQRIEILRPVKKLSRAA